MRPIHNFLASGAAHRAMASFNGALFDRVDDRQRKEAAAQGRLLVGAIGFGRLDPAWQTSTTVDLAETIYRDRAWDRLPILADALEDAGCDHAELLAHLRSGGPHGRGDWVVDVLTGRRVG